MAAMPAPHLLAFLLGALALNLAPGPDVLFASASGMQGGSRAGALAGLGTGLGSLAHVAMAVLGLGAMLAADPRMLGVIRWLGAGYLVWLAVRAWRAPAAPPAGPASIRRGHAVIGRAALTNLLNPKPLLFFLAFLPQFADPGFGPLWQQLLGLGLIFVASGTLVTAGYGALAGWAGGRIGARMTVMNRVAAALYLALAARLVLLR